MKKKILLSIFIILGIFLMSGCNNDKSNQNNAVSNNTNVETSNNVSNDDKILVVYFSKTGENYNVGTIDVGNTAMVATYISDYLNADSFEIVPVKNYPNSYNECLKVATNEQNENARPEIKNTLTNLDEYDTVFLGYPIWWGDLPMIVYTFLESYDFSNKIIIPFNTHEGSGDAGTYNTIKNKLTTANVNINGLALQGKVARTNEGKEKTINWLKELGY